MESLARTLCSTGFHTAQPRNQTADYTGSYDPLAMFLQKIDVIGVVSTHLWLYFRADSQIPAEGRAKRAFSS